MLGLRHPAYAGDGSVERPQSLTNLTNNSDERIRTLRDGEAFVALAGARPRVRLGAVLADG